MSRVHWMQCRNQFKLVSELKADTWQGFEESNRTWGEKECIKCNNINCNTNIALYLGHSWSHQEVNAVHTGSLYICPKKTLPKELVEQIVKVLVNNPSCVFSKICRRCGHSGRFGGISSHSKLTHKQPTALSYDVQVECKIGF